MDELINKYFLGELDSVDEAKLLEKLKKDKVLQEQFKEKQNLYALRLVLNIQKQRSGWNLKILYQKI